MSEIPCYKTELKKPVKFTEQRSSAWTTREYYGDFSISKKVQEEVDKYLHILPQTRKWLKDGLVKIWVPKDIIEKVINSSVMIIWKRENGSVIRWSGGFFLIDGEYAIVSNKHVVGVTWRTAQAFAWDIIKVVDLWWKDIPIHETYIHHDADVWFITPGIQPQHFYNLDIKWKKWDVSINTGISSARSFKVESKTQERSWLGILDFFILRILGYGKYSQVMSNTAAPWDSWSIVVNKEASPLCLTHAMSVSPLTWDRDTVCENMEWVKSAFRDFQLLKLQKKCWWKAR